MSYYKFTQPEVLAAFNANRDAQRALIKKCEEFAARFGPEKAACYYHSRELDLAGIVFSPRKQGPLWTVARAQDKNFQRPRATKVGLSFDLRIEQAKLKSEWETNWPKERVTMDDVWAAMGVQIDFLDGYTVFTNDEVVYFKGHKRPANGTEILGSEFDAAYAANRAAAIDEVGG